MSDRPDVLFGYNKKGEPVYVPLQMAGISGINESGKTQVAMTLAKRFAEAGVKILILDVKGIQRDYENFGDAEIPIYISRGTAPETLQRLLEQTAEGDQSFSREFDSILLAYQKCPDNDRTPLRMEKILQEWVDDYESWQEKRKAGQKAGQYPRHPLDAKADRKVLYFLKQLNKELEKIKPVDYLELPGTINVMDLHGLSREYQQLPIESLFRYLEKNVREVAPGFLFIIMDEAKRFIPQSAKAAAKQSVINAAKEFRSGGAFLCMIDQTISGVHIETRRQVWDWIMGRQGETVESERVFKEIPEELQNVPGAPVSPSMVKRLDTGWFIVWTRKGVDVAFHAPYWAPPEEARRVALGELTPRGLWNKYHSRVSGDDEEVWKEKYEELRRQHDNWVREHGADPRKMEELQVDVLERNNRIEQLETGYAALQKTAQEQIDRIESLKKDAEFGTKARELFQGLFPRTAPNPGGLTADDSRPTLDINEHRPPIKADDSTDLIGKLGILIRDGFFDERQTAPKIVTEFGNRGWSADRKDLEDVLVKMCDMKFLTRKYSTGNMFWYNLTKDAKERVRTNIVA